MWPSYGGRGALFYTRGLYIPCPFIWMLDPGEQREAELGAMENEWKSALRPDVRTVDAILVTKYLPFK